ncbi:MAG TPA: NAD(P)/FAD-dependent oxidoreductase [Pirellulales bacterium]
MTSEAWEVIVIGAGAAGLLAAARAAERGRRTLLLEKNRKPGVKILMSGGTRCNITQATDVRGIIAAFGPPGRFLHSALAALSPQALVELFEQLGVRTKVEPTGKIFPVSDKALDVQQALLKRLELSGATLAVAEPVCTLGKTSSGFEVATELRTLAAQSIILTTGGRSYPGSGTTGDGYAWAAGWGHTIVPPRPALVPITVSAEWVRQLSGVTIPDVAVRVVEPAAVAAIAAAPPGKRSRVQPAGELAAARGSFLFAHFGLSGPVILDVSRAVSGHPRPASLVLECDFLPVMTGEALKHAIDQSAVSAGGKQLVGLLPAELPRRLLESLFAQMGLPLERRGAEFGRQAREQLVVAIKGTRIAVQGTRGFEKAEVTAGGVSLDEVDSHTMASKLCPGLYLAGEVLDLDGPIGGYNFQAAFSTGWLAGSNV